MLAERDISAFQPLVVPRIQKKQPVVFASCVAGSDIMRDYGQTCGQRQKMGLFNPRNRGEQARFICCENARYQEVLRENKRKSEVQLNLRTGLSDWT